jgi:hypothetical protein
VDATTANAIVSAVAALAGGLIGSATTYATAAQQHRRLIKKERDEAKRSQEHLAAKACEEACSRIAGELEKARPPEHEKNHDAIQRRDERVQQAQSTFEASVMYLPDSTRERLEPLCDILSEAVEIAYGSLPDTGGTHYHSPYAICRNAKREVHAVVAAFLKGDPIPKPPSIILEYERALANLRQEYEEYCSSFPDDPPTKAFEKRRADFYKRNPDIRPPGDHHVP